jgi:exopolysaccharide production protein ExoZ
LTRGPAAWLSAGAGRQGISQREEIVGVQYLRGLAAVVVALDHGAGMAALGKYSGAHLWDGVLLNGRYGVDIFFLISGFIIAAVSLEGRDMAPAVGMRSFFARRFVRIVPMMWIAIVAFALLQLAGRGYWHPMATLRALTLWPWGNVEPSHIWTLRQELVFYLIFGLTMLSVRWLRFGLLLWVVAGLIASIWVPLAKPVNASPLVLLVNPANIEFGAGLALAVLWFRRSRDFAFKVPIDPLLLLTATTGVVVFAAVPLLGIRSGLWMALLFAPLLFFAIHVRCPPGPLRRFGELIGNASYSIYLFHPPVISAVLGVWTKLAPGTPLWLVVLGAALGATAAGVVAHLVLERPLLAVLRRRFGTLAHTR